MRMKSIWLIANIVLATVALAQDASPRSLRRLQLAAAAHTAEHRAQERQLNQKGKLLEPLLPFAEAVEKAKAGNPQGYYALAIHYARGEAIERNAETASQFLQKAEAANYPNAVFVAAMLTEESADKFRQTHSALLRNGGDRPQIHAYTGTGLLGGGFRFPQIGLTLTNATDVATIRAGYERAFNLGVSVATNELARFERRVEASQSQIRKEADAAKQKAENAKLAEGLL